jgi:hypothetical protein
MCDFKTLTFIFIFRAMKRYWENPFWEADCPVATRKIRLDNMYPDFDIWRRFTDIESCGEFEEVLNTKICRLFVKVHLKLDLYMMRIN